MISAPCVDTRKGGGERYIKIILDSAYDILVHLMNFSLRQGDVTQDFVQA